MNLRAIGNLIVAIFSLVSISILAAKGVMQNDWQYIAAAIVMAIVAIVNLYIAIGRMIDRTH